MRLKAKILFFVLGLCGLVPAAWAGTVTVTSGTTYQTISGFGASSQWDNTFSSSLATTFWSDDSNKPPASQVNGDVGLSILRLGIDDSGNANWGTQCAFATQALGINPNIKVFGSEWSPPAKWKNNNNVDGNNTGNDNGNPGTNTDQINTADFSNYAAYQTSFVTACKNTYGFTLTALSVQNEPDYDPSYDACLWSPANFDTYIKSYLGPDLQAAGFGTSIIMMPESFADNLTLSATTMGDSAAASFVGFIGMHFYGGGPNTVPTSYSTTAGHAVQSWETEISEKTTDNNIDSGIYYANLLHSAIVDHNFNAFCYWWLVNINTDDEGLCTSAGAATPRLYCLGNFSKFVRPGFVRIGATEVPSAGVSVSAYYSASAGKVVIVAINSNTGSTENETFNYSDLNVSAVYPWITDSANNLVQQTVQTVSGGSFTYTLPAESVVSFVASVSSSSNTATPTSTATRTNTPTVTRTNTPASTATFTPTNSLTATRTNTATSTASRTATPTSTNTVANTATFTPTATRTNTATSTVTSSPSATPTKTASSTATNTVANTATATRTNTSTNTITSTSTSTVTATPTATRTYTSTSTSSATPTNTMMNTATASNTTTKTVTSSPTNTFVNTATASSTATKTTTSTPTNTLMNTATPTATATPTSTMVNTATASSTVTKTTTSTPTNTLVNTVTPTATATPTNTMMNTATASNTATKTTTSTATNTFVNTATPTATATSTDTMINTATASNTVTKTRTFTPTNTFVNTATPTVTATATDTMVNTTTASNTATKTTTSTSTNTFVNTATPTATATSTDTLVNTATVSSTATKTTTSSPTDTFLNTATQTATATPTQTNTLMNTVTNTTTPMATHTATSTITVTTTATEVTVFASQGSNPPANSTQLAGASSVTIQQVQLTNPGDTVVTLSSLTLSETLSSTTGINSVSLVDNGVVISNSNFSGTTATFNLTVSNTIPANNGAVTYQVVVNFSTSAAIGSYPFSVTGAVGNNGQPVGFTGLPVNGATIVIVSATSTPTNTSTATASNMATKTATSTPTDTLVNTATQTATATPTPTASNTATKTTTSTPTNTFTDTITNTATSTLSRTTTPTTTSTATNTLTKTTTPTPTATPTNTLVSTATPTDTPKSNPGVVIYPNPVTGPTVSVLPPAYSGVSDVQVEIFTIAFREVQNETFRSVPFGMAVKVELTDKQGTPLANGLYYIVVIVDGHRSIGKLLVIR